MNTPSVSIIVAVYNAEPYLHRCMESILNQTLHNIEILLINDGSTDNSGQLCDDYAAKDPRVKVFHRTNHGLSATRQFGIEHITGAYVIHADPDDWLDLDMLEKMYQTAEYEQADMVFCDMIWEYEKTSKKRKQKPSSSNSAQVLVDIFTDLHASSCNKLIKVSCIQKYQIKFLEDRTISEDKLFNMRLLQNPLKVAYAPNTAYHYDQYSNASSICRPNRPDIVYNRVNFIQKMRQYQTTDSITLGISLTELYTAFQAIRTKAYSPADFFSVFAQLENIPILKLTRIPFHIRLIVWTAFHINYRTAERLMAFKLWYRRKIKRVE